MRRERTRRTPVERPSAIVSVAQLEVSARHCPNGRRRIREAKKDGWWTIRKSTNPSHPHATPLPTSLVDEGQTQADKVQRYQTDNAPQDDAGYPGAEGSETDAECQTGHADEGDEPANANQHGEIPPSRKESLQLIPDSKPAKTISHRADPGRVERTPPKGQTAARANILGVGAASLCNSSLGERYRLRKLSLRLRSRQLVWSCGVHDVSGFSFVRLSSRVLSGAAGLVLNMPHLRGSPLRDSAFARW